MTAAQGEGTVLTVGGRDDELNQRLGDELEAFNDAATGTSDHGALSVRVTDGKGGLIGGLAGWTWGGLFEIELLWVRASSRGEGWGSKVLRAAEEEAVRRGCDRVVLASYTFQAPEFYKRHGYIETGRTPGIPGGHADVTLYKALRPTVAA